MPTAWRSTSSQLLPRQRAHLEEVVRRQGGEGAGVRRERHGEGLAGHRHCAAGAAWRLCRHLRQRLSAWLAEYGELKGPQAHDEVLRQRVASARGCGAEQPRWDQDSAT